MIKLENLCKNFGELQVLKNINLEVKEGEKLVICNGVSRRCKRY